MLALLGPLSKRRSGRSRSARRRRAPSRNGRLGVFSPSRLDWCTRPEIRKSAAGLETSHVNGLYPAGGETAGPARHNGREIRADRGPAPPLARFAPAASTRATVSAPSNRVLHMVHLDHVQGRWRARPGRAAARHQQRQSRRGQVDESARFQAIAQANPPNSAVGCRALDAYAALGSSEVCGSSLLLLAGMRSTRRYRP